MEANEQKKKVSLNKLPMTESVAASAPSVQGKKISLDKQPMVKPAVVPVSPAPKKKISLNKQTQEAPSFASANPAFVSAPSVSSAPEFSSAPTVSSAHPVSKPISALPASSGTVPKAESISRGARPAADVGYKKGKASSGGKIIGIIVGIIIIAIIIVLLLLRSCMSEKQTTSAAVSQTEFVQPSQETSLEPEPGSEQEVLRPQEFPSEPELAVGRELPESPNLLALTHDAFYFMGDSDRFLPGSNYEGRLNVVAQDIKNILKVKPGQIFLISGYSADIPGHNQGELELSTQRADRVNNSLVQLGVPQASLECAYWGGVNKWGDNVSESTRSPNRVVTIELKD